MYPYQSLKTSYEPIHFHRFSSILGVFGCNMPYMSTLQRLACISKLGFSKKNEGLTSRGKKKKFSESEIFLKIFFDFWEKDFFASAIFFFWAPPPWHPKLCQKPSFEIQANLCKVLIYVILHINTPKILENW